MSRSYRPSRHLCRPLALITARAAGAVLLTGTFVAVALPQARLLASGPAAGALAHMGNPVKLISTRTITPMGMQTRLGNLPMNAALSPDGKYLLVANSGARDPETLQVISTASHQVIQTLPYAAPDGVVFGLAYSPDGRQAFSSGGGYNTIHTYMVSKNGMLTPAGDVSLGAATASIYPMGMSVTPDGSALMVADNLSDAVSLIGLNVDTGNNSAAVLQATIPAGHYPYSVVVAPDGKRAFVSNWADATVGVIDVNVVTKTLAAAMSPAAAAGPAAAGKGTRTLPAVIAGMVKTIPVGRHPSGMAFGPRGMLYVANANSDSVSVINTATMSVVRTISVSPYRGAPLSSSPVSVAVAPDGHTLYVANAGENAVVALDAMTGRTLGRLPTAWYPSTVALSNDGRTMYVTNAKGGGAGPNGDPLLGPNPARRNGPFALYGGYCNCAQSQYSGSMIDGSLSTSAVPGAGELGMLTTQVNRNNRVHEQALLMRSAGNPIPAVAGAATPFKHVIYIDKENRTFDQVFGDESAGNRDPHLTLFGRAVTPNLHALSERFGLFDNFYADAEVSADGHNWINGAYASDYNEKMWPQDYSQGVGRNRGYDFEGDTLINLNPGGYLWDAAAEAGVSYRDYGNFFVFHSGSYLLKNAKIMPASQAANCPGPLAHSYSSKKVTIPAGMALCLPAEQANPTTTPHLIGHIDPRFRTFDGNYREADRVAEWLREFKAFVAGRNLPALELLRFPNDHTSGTRAGQLTPQAFVAENDAAVAAVVDAVSHSPYWKDTLIVVTEDDAQNGPDHVDAHRTEALVVSAYNSYHALTVDHTMYDTASMVRTVELVLGLRPLSQYDAQAMPMAALFKSTPDLTPYTARAETIAPTTVNRPKAYGFHTSGLMDFTREDRAPADTLNTIIWHAVKGKDSAYPVTHYTYSGGDDH